MQETFQVTGRTPEVFVDFGASAPLCNLHRSHSNEQEDTRMETRAAILWNSPGKWTVQDVQLDSPGPSELLVEMVATGLCHSDEHMASGDMDIETPIIAGHEGAGIVREVGSEVHDLEVGDHVITSFIPACGKCRFCAMGLQNLCKNGAMILEGTQPSGGFRMHANGQGIPTMSALGTFAEWQVYDQMSVLKIDKSIPLDSACLVSCGVQTGFGSATNAGNVRPGDVVLVIGIGGVGINAVQGAAFAGASHIIAVDPVQFKLDEAKKFGATQTFTDFDEADAFAKAHTDWQGADVAILTPGLVSGELLGKAYGAIRKAGTVVVTGVSPIEDEVIPGLNAFTLAMFQKRIQGALYGMASPREAMPMLLNLYQSGKLKLDELITRRYILDEINECNQDMRDGKNIRGVIVFNESLL
ncbi:MAG: S-(hydroxymethyl)glutathione dehydrogenase [Thermoleophilia bacterium]|nr:S-(hydroxymethyl)glutathione dehydrogenase [Thermoleophilia bacterium]